MCGFCVKKNYFFREYDYMKMWIYEKVTWLLHRTLQLLSLNDIVSGLLFIILYYKLVYSFIHFFISAFDSRWINKFILDNFPRKNHELPTRNENMLWLKCVYYPRIYQRCVQRNTKNLKEERNEKKKITKSNLIFKVKNICYNVYPIWKKCIIRVESSSWWKTSAPFFI